MKNLDTLVLFIKYTYLIFLVCAFAETTFVKYFDKVDAQTRPSQLFTVHLPNSAPTLVPSASFGIQ